MTTERIKKKQAAARSKRRRGGDGRLVKLFSKSARKASDGVRDDLRRARHENPQTINRDYLPAAPQFRSLGQFTPFRFVSRQESEREDGSLGFLPMQIKTVSDRERGVFQGPKTEMRVLSGLCSQTKNCELSAPPKTPATNFVPLDDKFIANKEIINKMAARNMDYKSICGPCWRNSSCRKRHVQGNKRACNCVTKGFDIVE